MTKKRGGTKQSTVKKSTISVESAIINRIIDLHKIDRTSAAKLAEEQARRVWLEYLFQTHREVKEVTEVEEVEERTYDPSVGEIVTQRTTKRTRTEIITPKTPVWAVKAAIVRWENLSNFEEINAIQLLVESGLYPENALDIIAEQTSGVPKALLNPTEKAE